MKKAIIFLLAALMLTMTSCAFSNEEDSSEVIDGIDKTNMIIYGEIIEVRGDYDVTVKVYDDELYGYNGKKIKVEYQNLEHEDWFEFVKPEIGMKIEIAYTHENIVESGDDFSIVYNTVGYLLNSDGSEGECLNYVKFI